MCVFCVYQRRETYSTELQLETAVSCTWVLGTGLGISGRTASVLDYLPFFQVPDVFLFKPNFPVLFTVDKSCKEYIHHVKFG